MNEQEEYDVLELSPEQVDAKVKEILAMIETEKRTTKPDKKRMRELVAEIRRLKGDFRTIHQADADPWANARGSFQASLRRILR